MKTINIKNIENKINLLVLSCIVPIGYFAPIAEWLLISVLALFSILRYSLNFHKNINKVSIILFFLICIVFLNSYFFSVNPDRTLEVIWSKIGIIFAVIAIITLSSQNKIEHISKYIAPSILFISLIIFFDLCFNTEIRTTLASIVGDKPTSESANYSRGLLVLAAIMPITIAILLNDKKYVFSVLIFIFILLIILIGPNYTAKITLICSIVSALIIYFLGPKSFYSFGIVSVIFILSLPILSTKFLPKIGNYQNKIESTPWQETSAGGSLIHRILVWEYVGKEIIKKPLFGHGLGTSRHIGQNIILKIPNSDQEIKGGIPLHPHNNFLQIWLELGIIGVAIFLYIWFTIIKFGHSLRSKSYILGTGACTSIISMFIICNLSFGFFQAWWMSLIGLIFLLIIQSNKEAFIKN